MNPIDLKTLIETILGVRRNSNGSVNSYGLVGKYNYKGGFSNTAFNFGITPQVESVEGLECVLNYPQAKNIMALSTNDIYSEKLYRLSLIQRSGSNGHNAVMLLERSGEFMALNYLFIQASPNIGNFPQWNLNFKIHELRRKLDSYNYS
jgi:hypothetical protein